MDAFRIGAKVEVIRGFGAGRVATVVKVPDPDGNLVVQWDVDDGERARLEVANIKLIGVAAPPGSASTLSSTRPARRMLSDVELGDETTRVLTCKGWNAMTKTVFMQVDGVETEPIVKLSLKRWWAKWVYGKPKKEKLLYVDALPLTYAMATTPDASQGEGYEYLHYHTKSTKADNRNMVYMCMSPR